MIDIKVYRNDILLYDGPIDYADEKIKNMTYKDVIPTGNGLTFYV